MTLRPGLLLACVLLCGALRLAAQSATLPTDGRIVNFSARATLATSNDPLIAGFVFYGANSKTLLLRGVGPTLADFNVPSPLADPALALYRGSTPLDSNDDWLSGTIMRMATSGVGAFALGSGSHDAAMVASIGAAGAYTAVLSGQNGTTGTALAELYEIDPLPNGRIYNFSARATIGGAAGAMTLGFVIKGDLPRRVLVRAAGPALGAFMSGTIADPQLTLFRDQTVVLQNDNWAGNATLKAAFAAAGAFSFASDTSRDAALLATLEPGVYTVQIAPVGNASGVVLGEIYDITPASTAAPTLVVPPTPLTVVPGASASLTVIASSSGPVNYQWRKDGVAIAGATSDTLLLNNAQAADAGSYTVTVANTAGAVTSAPVAVTLQSLATTLPPASTFDLVGFATKGTGMTGGGILLPGDANYRVLDASIANKAQQLRTWLESTTPLVVDVQVDVDLGALNNVLNRPKTNPELVASGLGVINVRSNKTVFSSTGATLRHGMFNLSNQSNIIVRNLRFRGLWEFDEGSQNAPDNAPWGYKIQDWDYFTIQNNARNVWVDHCDFEKSYDGIADVKAAADLVTFSWCRLGGDTEGAVARQVAYLEKIYQGALTDSRLTTTFYTGLRNGVYASQGIPLQTPQDIVTRELPHDKCNLIGSSDTATGDIGNLNVTFHHIYYHACQQRLPRMRFGNAHVYNIYVDNSIVQSGANMATATTCDAAVFAENNYYLEVADPFPAQSGTSPPGRITQTGSKWIYHGADTSLAGNTFLKDPATWTWNTATKNFTWAAAPAPNAKALPYSYTADPVDYTKNNLSQVGVIVPATAADQAVLASYLVRTAH